jgi:hypothetical protein
MLRQLIANSLFLRGNGLLQSGQARRALPHLALAARLAASSAPHFGAAALAASQAGKRDDAVRYGERALALDPSLEVAHEVLFHLFMHGENYFNLLGRIHEHLKPRTYIEIGVETGASLVFVQPGTVALGVDPEPKISHPVPPNARVFAQTSDDFFRRDVRTELGGLPVDLALVDGMHHFEFALRDFMNLERLAAPTSTILIHDCFPHDRRTAERERMGTFWSGDVWRLIVLLKKYRPDLQIHVVAAPPTGLAVVRNLDPHSRVIADSLERLCAEFLALDYSFLEKDRAGKLNLFPNDWERVRALLDAPPVQQRA